MKSLIKLTLSLVVLLSFLIPSGAEAAAAKTGYVNITSGKLNVRSTPSTSGKVVGTLKKDTKLTVYSQTKSGWSEIRYKSKKAYVATKYIRYQTSYLMDPSKKYVYKANGEYYSVVYAGKYNGWDKWKTNANDYHIVYEDAKGLYSGWMESEYYMDLMYPVKVNKKWNDGLGEDYYKWVSGTNKTVKTGAGTFKGCIETKEEGGYTTYIAPNVGIVKTYYKGKVVSELVSLKKK
ncbi:SH3 domain-containing protein [Peribacillus sp. SCS-26]|uniref:SH3 domain-containing protein n=1 Tax=Paraperibacillus marinus TaxID=3115295 RepID=UPI00390657CF